MKSMRTVLGTVLVGAALVTGAGAAQAAEPSLSAAAPLAAPASPCTRTDGLTFAPGPTVYARGTGGCVQRGTTLTVELLRAAPGQGATVAARATCQAARLGTCFAATPRVAVQPGVRYSVRSFLR